MSTAVDTGAMCDVRLASSSGSFPTVRRTEEQSFEVTGLLETWGKE